jgi:N6-L-threonylcarbamoyladenine synthase
MLIHSASLTSHTILANTVDIAIGDMLDKAARLILPPSILSRATSPAYGALLESYAFPNGLNESKYSPPATRGDEVASCYRPGPYGWSFPLPLTISEGGKKAKLPAFAFSGMNTYVARLVTDGWDHGTGKLSKVPRATPISEDERRWLAREVMRVGFEHLASRVVLVLQNLRQEYAEVPRSLVISGGVASNSFLRLILRKFLAVRGFGDVEIIAPPVEFCTDNAAMIAWAGLEMYEAGHSTDMGFRALRKWSLENLECPEREEDYKDVLTVLREKGRGPVEDDTIMEGASDSAMG